VSILAALDSLEDKVADMELARMHVALVVAVSPASIPA
jgi:hypothetical protein